MEKAGKKELFFSFCVGNHILFNNLIATIEKYQECRVRNGGVGVDYPQPIGRLLQAEKFYEVVRHEAWQMDSLSLFYQPVKTCNNSTKLNRIVDDRSS